MEKLTSTNTKGKIGRFIDKYKLNLCTGGYEDYKTWYKKYSKEIDDKNRVIAFDIETSKLYPINNTMISFALAYTYNNEYHSICINTKEMTNKEIVSILKSLNALKSRIILHNAYFDISTLSLAYGITVDWAYDTYIIYHCAMTHRTKDDKNGDMGTKKVGLSLKDLTRDYLTFGDYEEDLNVFKAKYIKENKINVKSFSYAFIPFNILAPYNCMDVICTLQLYELGLKLINNLIVQTNYDKLREVIKLKHDVTKIYIEARVRGINIDRDKCLEIYEKFKKARDENYAKFKDFYKEEIAQVERELRFIAFEKDMFKDYASKLPLTTDSREVIYTKKMNLQEEGISEKELAEEITKEKGVLHKRGLKSLSKEKFTFNLKSSKHKKMLFFDILKFKPLTFTKKKQPMCDKNFLTYYADESEGMKYLFEYGLCNTAINNFLGVEKVEGTQLSSKELEVGATDDAKTLFELTTTDYPYVHPSYNLCGTLTHRCSCSAINVQQIPSKGVLHILKECFKAREGHYFVYSDYSSAESVILGSLIGSKSILESLKNKWDLHSINAWKIFHDEITAIHPDWDDKFKASENDIDLRKQFYTDLKSEFGDTYRYKSKSVGFGMSYGITEHGLSKNLKIPKKEAKEILDKYLSSNIEMKKYIKHQHDLAIHQGYTENSFGARVMLMDCPKMYSTEDKEVKARGNKQLKKALNVPIQSANAFLLYKSLIKAKEILKEEGLEDKVHFIFSVYDSYCYEVSDDVPKDKILDILERAFIYYLGDYYLGVDAEIGLNWGETEEVKRPRREREDVENFDMKIY